MIEDKLETVFAELGERNSGPRRLLTEELTQLAQTGEGFTAEELWHRLQKSNQKIGRATIFRAVKQLTERNVLDCIDFSDGTRLYRACGGRLHDTDRHHHHLACTTCHRITDFHFCFPAGELEQVGLKEGFLIKGHTLTVFGVCRQCRGGPGSPY
jgi:Fur family ferric uptake transcriptional regulator